MNLQEILKLPAQFSENNLPYPIQPNVVDLVFTNILPPRELTSASFVLPFYRTTGKLLLAYNNRRGVDIPGGRTEPGETAEEAATRECEEETGAIVTGLIPIGFQRIVSTGVAPEGYRYPHPISFQQFFAGVIVSSTDFIPNDECGMPVLYDNFVHGTTLPVNQCMLIQEARRVLFG